MRLSTRGRYGIQAMFDLACCDDACPQSIKQIADRQGLSEAYLEQLFAALKKDKLVCSVRGAQGGYVLARSADQITVGDVLRSMEGTLDLVDCLSEESSCRKACDCASRQVWLKLSNGLNQIADSITLQDMIEDHKRRMAQEG